MQFVAIVLVSICAAVCYGIVHDQITIRVCLEYFTVAHPDIFGTQSPTLLALGWGVIATWWVGLILGVGLAAVARFGSNPPRVSWRAVTPAIVRLLCVMAISALVAGVLGYWAGERGMVSLPSSLDREVPVIHHAAFVATWCAHLASYFSGIVGGVVVIVYIWRARGTLHLAATI